MQRGIFYNHTYAAVLSIKTPAVMQDQNLCAGFCEGTDLLGAGHTVEIVNILIQGKGGMSPFGLRGADQKSEAVSPMQGASIAFSGLSLKVPSQGKAIIAV